MSPKVHSSLAGADGARPDLSVRRETLWRGWGQDVNFDFEDMASTDAESWSVAIPTDDTSIVRRRRALAPIEVLIGIEYNKAHYDGDFWDNYDLYNIALGVIDQVALAMGISAGRTWDETVDYAVSEAQRQSPTGGRQQWQAVADRVVLSLVTTDYKKIPYLVHGESGPEWMAQRFRLLYVHSSGEEGTEYLRASEQAINIFVQALDLDIEAAQIASEAQLQVLIARGSFASAVQIAKTARYQSIQYQERIVGIIKDTLRDPAAHDWIGEVPALLDSALNHVRDRLTAEAAIIDAVVESRSNMADPDGLVAANQLIESLRDCRRRHNELHTHLIGARSRLRDALEDRLSRPPSGANRLNVYTGLLQPLLLRPSGESAVATDRLLALVGGIGARWWPSLGTITDELCAPPRTPEEGDQFVEPEFDDDDDRLQWWEPYEAAVESLLGGVDEPIRLSQLLARAETVAEALVDGDGEPLDPRLLKAAAVHAAHRAWATHLTGRLVGDRVLLAVTTGTLIDDDGIASEDLLLVPAEVARDIIEPAAARRQRGRGAIDLDDERKELSA